MLEERKKSSSSPMQKKLAINIISMVITIVAVIITFYAYSAIVSDSQVLEKKNASLLNKDIQNIFKINKDVLKISKTTQSSIEKSTETTELLEFAGSISKHLLKLSKDVSSCVGTPEHTLVVNMIGTWNEKTIKMHPLLSGFYPAISKELNTLKTAPSYETLLKIQNIFEDIFAKIIDHAYDTSDQSLALAKKLEKNIDKTNNLLEKNLQNIEKVEVVREKGTLKKIF